MSIKLFFEIAKEYFDLIHSQGNEYDYIDEEYDEEYDEEKCLNNFIRKLLF
jgi:hypothetical protein